jgi:hypothetical protein
MRTTQRQLVHRTLLLAVGISVLTVGCGSSTPKATSVSTKTAAKADATDSEFCQTARKWMVHQLNGDGDSFAADPVAFKKYWGEYMDFIATATRQSPAEIREYWPIGYDLLKQFTPVLQKYDFDIERIKAEGSAAEIATGKRLDEGPNPAEQRAQDAVHEYEGRVCQTSQPPAADVSFAGAKANKAYCDAVQAADELLGETVVAKQFSIDAVRTFVTSDEFTALAGEAKKNAPAEIEADVVADVDWQLNQQVEVMEKFGYDVRKLFLEGSAADRAIFQRSDPAVADHYARTVAYEENVCGQ